MTDLEAAAIFGTGIVAGAVNAAVGSGTLITFPMLLAAGYPPVIANVTNTVGLIPGALSGAIGYRRELASQRSRLRWLGIASTFGGATGALLLAMLPTAAFDTIVPVLIAFACASLLLQTRLAVVLNRRRKIATHRGRLAWLGAYGVGVYGGYFGAAQGFLTIALMGMIFNDSIQSLNAARNVLSLLANLAAALLFIAILDVAWFASALIATGSTLGGILGAGLGRKLPPIVLRGCLLAVAVVTIVSLIANL